MPRTTLQMLRLEPDLVDRRVVVEEYVVEGKDANAMMTGVTYGLYATIDEMADGADLRQFFQHALQMQSQLGARPHASVTPGSVDERDQLADPPAIRRVLRELAASASAPPAGLGVEEDRHPGRRQQPEPRRRSAAPSRAWR